MKVFQTLLCNFNQRNVFMDSPNTVFYSADFCDMLFLNCSLDSAQQGFILKKHGFIAATKNDRRRITVVVCCKNVRYRQLFYATISAVFKNVYINNNTYYMYYTLYHQCLVHLFIFFAVFSKMPLKTLTPFTSNFNVFYSLCLVNLAFKC